MLYFAYMDDQNFSMNQFGSSNSQFELWRKWFWIGIIAAILSPILGLVYGIALAIEKDRRNEGIIIVAVAIAWAFLFIFFIIPWLSNLNSLPHVQLPK